MITHEKQQAFDVDYIRRCQSTTLEQRLDWLAAAQEFVQAVREGQKSDVVCR